MIREICKDEFFLSQKSEPATADDLAIVQDLLDTLAAHKDGCVGMAANMIGVNKRIIAFDNIGTYMVMFNPVIVKKSAPYDAEEGCLSLIGTAENEAKAAGFLSSSRAESRALRPATTAPPRKVSSPCTIG